MFSLNPLRLRLLPVFSLTAFLAASFLPLTSAAEDTRVYELRTYTTLPGRYEALLTRFRDHTVRLFEKHGMTNVGYWQPMDAANGAGQKLIYLLSYPSREAATASWKAFSADPEWQKVKKASEEDGKIISKVESVFLKTTDFSPALGATSSGGSRVFELRTYVTEPGRLAALDTRFRDHTLGFFKHYGMTNLIYFHPVDADKGADNTLIYFLAHSNRKAADASWSGFRADPKWIAAKGASETSAGGSLTVPNGVTSVFLTPVDFSPLK